MVRPLTDNQASPDPERLAAAVERLGRLPVLSATVRRVQATARSEEAGIGDMVAALEADQGWRPTCCGASGGPAVGLSIGAASPGETSDSLACVLSRADEALYEAKRAGRGRAVRL